MPSNRLRYLHVFSLLCQIDCIMMRIIMVCIRKECILSTDAAPGLCKTIIIEDCQRNLKVPFLGSDVQCCLAIITSHTIQNLRIEPRMAQKCLDDPAMAMLHSNVKHSLVSARSIHIVTL